MNLWISEFPFIWGKFYFIFYQCNEVNLRLVNDQCDHAPVADVDANASHDEVDKLVDLGVEVRSVVDDIDVWMVPPRLHRSPVPLPRQLQTLEPESTCNIISLRVQRGSVDSALACCKTGPEFKARLSTPGRFFPLSEEAKKKMERGLEEWRLCYYECMYW